uniref:Uncharacterized protein n=1 Tax=Tanacetum cinerariifolium TaxID=118510 RepID=A0A699H1E3_TANCI|nr:hypothetical protein [Tanacetum cinerariifolium]
MTPAQALIAIHTMADHYQKWHDGSSSRNIDNINSSEGIASIVSKLDSLGWDMKKLKENVHAFQVGCQTCGGSHLDKEYLGASVNVIPTSVFQHLKLSNLKKIDMLVEVVDMTKRTLIGMVENILIKIDKFLFPSDSYLWI